MKTSEPKVPQTISIIGGRGKMGSIFTGGFREEGYEVLVSNAECTNNIELAEQGDVVVVSVPLKKTEEVIQQIGPYVRKEALLTDLASVKIKPVAAMIKYSQSEIIGGHPLFGPDAELQGQNMILCPTREEGYLSWYKKTLESLGIKITLMDPEEHDKTMAAVQCLTYISNIVFSHALAEMGYQSIPENLTAPAYLLRLSSAAKMFVQDPSLYADILSENPFAEEAMRAYREAAKKVDALMQEPEKKGLEGLLGSLRKEIDCPYLHKKLVKIIDG